MQNCVQHCLSESFKAKRNKIFGYIVLVKANVCKTCDCNSFYHGIFLE